MYDTGHRYERKRERTEENRHRRLVKIRRYEQRHERNEQRRRGECNSDMARERKNKESKQRRSLLRRFFLDAPTNRQYERMQKKRKRRRHKTKEQDQQRTSYLYCNDKEGFHDGVERSKHRENGSHKQEGYCLANTGRHRMEDRKEERRAKKRRTKCCSSKKGTFC